MGMRTRGREATLQVLYQLEAAVEPENDTDFQGALLQDMHLDKAKNAITLFFANFEAPEKVKLQTESLVLGVLNNIDAINGLIESNSNNWRLSRLAMVDRNVMRIAIFELKFGEKLPKRIVIDEAVHIAKRYGSERSAAFVNGVLATISKDLD